LIFYCIDGFFPWSIILRPAFTPASKSPIFPLLESLHLFPPLFSPPIWSAPTLPFFTSSFPLRNPKLLWLLRSSWWILDSLWRSFFFLTPAQFSFLFFGLWLVLFCWVLPLVEVKMVALMQALYFSILCFSSPFPLVFPLFPL